MTNLKDVLNDYEIQLLEVLELSPTDEQLDMLAELKEETHDRMRELIERII
jgi:hypothetical protein